MKICSKCKGDKVIVFPPGIFGPCPVCCKPKYYNAMPDDRSPRIRGYKVVNKDGSVSEYTVKGRLKKKRG